MRRSARTLAPLPLVAAMLLAATPARAALPSTQPDDTGMLNGKVRAIAQAGGHVWIGGSFTQALNASGQAAQAVNSLVAFDPNSGLLDTSVNQPDVTNGSAAATVYDAALGPDGKLYFAGRFTAVNGQARKNVAAIDPVTGNLLAFDPGTAEATAIYASSTNVYVGTDRILSFAFNGTSTPDYTPPQVSVDPSLRGHNTPPQIRDITQVGSDVIAACQCDAITDTSGTRNVKALVKVDAGTGDWVNWRPSNLTDSSGAFGISLVTHVAPGGGPLTIYLAAGGSDFTAAYTESSGKQQWKTDTSGSSQAITWFQGDLIVGGHFNWTQAPGSGSCGSNDSPNLSCYHTPKLVAMDPAKGGVLLVGSDPWNPGICCKYNGVWALLTDADGVHLHVGGEFTKAGGTWSGSGKNWSLSGASTQQYYARFGGSVIGQQQLTVTKHGTGSGTVSSSPAGIDCGATCTATFAQGAMVSLSAQADPGSTFAGWGGDCSGTGNCKVTLTNARAVTATFTKAATATCGDIAFVSARKGDGDVFVMDAAGKHAVDVSNDPAPDLDPAWSPDCSQIAFSGSRNGDGDIFVMDADGKNVQALTSGNGNDTQPTWSPDGSQLAFTSDRTGDRELYVMDADGKHLTQITTNSWADQQPDWSPDGTKLVFASNRGGTMQIYTVWPDGSHRKQITSGGKANDQPAWSPSGDRLAYVGRTSGTPQIWTMKPKGKDRVRLSSDGKRDGHPTWSPNGKRLAYDANASSGARQIWKITAKGKNATKLTSQPAGNTDPSWS